jgi:hypothetical protein
MTNTSDPSEFLLAEYNALRGEILKRSEIQHQLISFALAASGALAAVGLKDTPSALLAYPILVLFLAIGWTYNDLQIAQIGLYIKHRIERHLAATGQGWQHAILSQRPSREIGSLAKVATRGMFWGTEILAVGLYLLMTLPGRPIRLDEPRAEDVLLIISIVATVVTMWVMRNRDSVVREIERDMERGGSAAPTKRTS